MSSFKLQTDGVKGLADRLEAIGDEVMDMPAFRELSERMAALARSFAPRRTGALARSIQPSATPNRATIVATARYAIVINYGSRKRNIAPSRFLQRVDPAIAREADAAVDKAIDRAINSNSGGRT